MAEPKTELAVDPADLEPGARRGLLRLFRRWWGVNNVPVTEGFFKSVAGLLEVRDEHPDASAVLDVGPISRGQALRLADLLARSGDNVREVSEDAARFLHALSGALMESVKTDIEARTDNLNF